MDLQEFVEKELNALNVIQFVLLAYTHVSISLPHAQVWQGGAKYMRSLTSQAELRGEATWFVRMLLCFNE